MSLTHVKLPQSLRCIRCGATHRLIVYRFKAEPKMWWPGPEPPPWPNDYESKPETIDLMLSKVCARCSAKTALPKSKGSKNQLKLF
jgi:DNA-directed RNA polymerase subunit RPC12/RpoP